MTIKFKIKAIHELTLDVDEKQFEATTNFSNDDLAGHVKDIAEQHIEGIYNLNDPHRYISGVGLVRNLGIKIIHEDSNTIGFEEVQS